MHNTQTLLSVDHTSDAIVPMNIVDLSNQNNMRSDFRYSDNNLSQGRAGHNSMLGARTRSDCAASATQLLSHFGTAARHEMSKGDNKGGSRKIIDLRCLRNLKPAARFFLHVSKT